MQVYSLLGFINEFKIEAHSFALILLSGHFIEKYLLHVRSVIIRPVLYYSVAIRSSFTHSYSMYVRRVNYGYHAIVNFVQKLFCAKISGLQPINYMMNTMLSLEIRFVIYNILYCMCSNIEIFLNMENTQVWIVNSSQQFVTFHVFVLVTGKKRILRATMFRIFLLLREVGPKCNYHELVLKKVLETPSA